MPASPLDPHPAPLTAADARHLLRRAGFGSPDARVGPLVGLSAADAARRLLGEAAAAPALVDPLWYLPTATDSALLYTESETILRRMLVHPVREKLVLFLHNHFATELRVYNNPAWGWLYYKLLHTNALGSFRTLVHEVGLNPAMLRYLNGDQNRRGAANQNYARELLELFTMGQYAPEGGGALNYTETDVAEAARALTGYRTRNGAEVYLDTTRFDTGTKVVFGLAGPWAYADIVRLVFERRREATARFMARKLLAFYVSSVPDVAAEIALAQILMGSATPPADASTDFALRPALEALFASQHFYDAGLRGALVKGPLDAFVGLLGSLSVAPDAFDANYVRSNARARGQEYLNTPDVAGWDGHNPPNASNLPGFQAWYKSDSFGPLWSVLRVLARNERGAAPYTNGRAPYDALALARLGPDPNDAFRVATAIAEHLLAVPLVLASVPALDAPFAGDPNIPVPDHAQSAPRYVRDLAKLLLGTTPFYEWPGLPAAMRTERVRAYVTFLATELPEFFLY